MFSAAYWRLRLRVTRDGHTYFVHHRPAVRNLGDELCSPKHYFSIHSADGVLYVLGGGVFPDWGRGILRRVSGPPQRTVMWGVGQSRRRPSDPVPDVPEYLAAATRDPNRATGRVGFVPCVSCLHPMLDSTMQGEETLVYLNRDADVSSLAQVGMVSSCCSRHGLAYVDNSCTAEAFSSALSRSKRLITNSFHGAYWGLLSGRSVTVLGYSSKFRSLFLALDLPMRIVSIAKFGDDLFPRLVESATDRSVDSRLGDPAGKLEEFRGINLDFARSLQNVGVEAVPIRTTRLPPPESAVLRAAAVAARWRR